MADRREDGCRCKRCEAGEPHEQITASDRKMLALFFKRYPAPRVRRILKRYDPKPPTAASVSAARRVRQPWEPRPARRP